MKLRLGYLAILITSSLTVGASAQQPAIPQAAPVERKDPAVDAANDLVGRALFLRCLCFDSSIAFDADGHPEQAAKPADWTLAGVNVLKVERKDPATVELDGVRVAIRYAPDRHEFDRHALNDEKVKILLHDAAGTGPSFEKTLHKVFSEGIDVSLQRAMPPYWQHYFNPKAAWPKDALEGEAIVTPGAPSAPAGLTDPKPVKKSEPAYTAEASHDRVQGSVLVQMVVDGQGEPHRPVIVQPLGYGLDATTVAAAEKYRFQPATAAGGKTLAANVQIRQEFTVVPVAAP